MCFAVKLSNGETMETNNLFCFNGKYVSWWETKPGINIQGTLNNGPLAGMCTKRCCSFSTLPSIPVPVWLCKIAFLKKQPLTGVCRTLMCNRKCHADRHPKQMIIILKLLSFLALLNVNISMSKTSQIVLNFLNVTQLSVFYF